MERKMNRIILLLIIGIVLFMSAGYSVLNSDLNISGELTYRPKTDIRITNIKQKSLSNVTIQYANFSQSEISLAYDPQTIEASVTLEIEVTNYTDSPMGILKIENLPESATIEGYNLKEALENSKGILKAGDSTTFTITFRAQTTDMQQILLIFEFREVYKVTYTGFSNTDFKTEVMKGDSFSQNIGASIELCSVTMNGSAISNYNFSNGVITISNVTGDIVIDGVTLEKEEPTIPNKPELNGDMIPVYYDEDETVWKKADINNANNNWYDYNTQKWANVVTVVEESVKDLSGNNHNGAVHGAKVENGEAYFDGVDDYVEAGYANYDFKDSISINVIFKINNFTSGIQCIIGNPQGAGVQLQFWESKKIGFGIHDGTAYQSFTPNFIFELDKWYELIVTFYQNKISFYIRDDSGLHTFTKEFTSNMNVKVSPMSFALGVNLDYNGMEQQSNVSISKASVYDREISVAEVENDNIKKDNALFEYDFSQMINRDDYVTAEKDTIIPISDINTMWVWIPRYSYTIKSEDGTNYYGKRSSCTIPSQKLPGEIDVKFINTNENGDNGNAQYKGNKAENWRTNEAFNFDGAKAGIWVGKFETTGSYTETCKNESCSVSGVTILPNKASIRSKTVSNFFYMSRSMQMNNNEVYGFETTKGDLHIIKNDEWGAVAYLSQSRYGKYGNSDYSGANKEVYINNNSLFITGTSGGPSASNSGVHYEYDDMTELGGGKGKAGPGASTTGTIYGIYDMSGGAYEYVMGVLEYDSQTENEHPGVMATGSSGFRGLNSSETETGTIDLPDKKYYNTYKSVSPTSNLFTNASTACKGGVCYGHALSETYGTTSGSTGWYQDYASFVYRSAPWSLRGGYYNGTTNAGVFSAYNSNGGSLSDNSSRLVLV